jgi:hypothetical protein
LGTSDVTQVETRCASRKRLAGRGRLAVSHEDDARP